MRGASATIVDLLQVDLSEMAPHEQSSSSERRLLGTVLHDAIEDAVNPRRSTRRENTVTQEARAWIFGEPDREAPRRWELGDFEPLCWALDLDPEAVRKIVREAIAGIVPRKRRCRLTTVRVRGAAA